MAATISVGFLSSFVAGEISHSRRAFLTSVSLPSSRREAPVSISSAASSKSAAETAGKRQPRGITKPKPVSPELQAVVGVKEIPRTQALKVIWAYIKENNLQDPENKKIIVCDEKLKNIFGGRDRVGFLEISGLVNPHFEK